jgi:tRNA-dihydrouridine synthase B
MAGGGKAESLRIGRLRVENPVFLAPMAGYSDAAFRAVCFGEGCGGAVTEMVNAHGLTIGHARTNAYLERLPEEGGRALGAQIYGSDPGVMETAAGVVAGMGKFEWLDINAGCPMPKIRNRGDGAGLMRTPGKLAEIVRRVKAAVGDMPVTVKTRIGWDADSVNALETTAGAEEAGADAIFLHGRVATVRHSGPCDWEMLAKVKAARKIPVIGNGGIKSPADAEAMRRETGVDGVMIGRGAIGNPWVFRSFGRAARGEEDGLPSAEEIRATIRRHLDLEMELMRRRGARLLKDGEEITACLILRPHVVRYLKGFRRLRDFALHLNERQDAATFLGRIDEVLEGGRKRDGGSDENSSLG